MKNRSVTFCPQKAKDTTNGNCQEYDNLQTCAQCKHYHNFKRQTKPKTIRERGYKNNPIR